MKTVENGGKAAATALAAMFALGAAETPRRTFYTAKTRRSR